MFDTLSDKITDAFRHFSGQNKISEKNIDDTLEEVRKALLEADVNFKVVRAFVEKVKAASLGEKVVKGVKPGEKFVQLMHTSLTELMGGEETPLKWNKSGMVVTMVVGLNGAGKTTFSGKLARYLKNEVPHKKVLLIPADTYRPAAKDQLMILGTKAQVDVFDSDLSSSPREVVLQGVLHGQRHGYEIVIIDTAGRLHVDEELMNELADVKMALDKFSPEVLLVADAMTGQEATHMAEMFQNKVGLTGVVLSKLDSDTRGGAALSIRYVTGVPIRFSSIGEKIEDLELFHADRMAGRILDMGDVLTLVEKAEQNLNEEDALSMVERMQRNQFTINDFVKQLEFIGKLGPLASVAKMIPGMGGLTKGLNMDFGAAEGEFKGVKVIVSSMTKEERENETLLFKQQSRIRRIAKGSGRSESDVRQFLDKFKQMKQMLPSFMGMMTSGKMPDPRSQNPFGLQQGMGKSKKKGGGGGGFGRNRFFK